MTRGRQLYPVLFAAFPVLGQTARNPGLFRPIDAVVVIAIVLSTVVIVYAVVYGVARTRRDPVRSGDIAAFAAFVWVVVFYLYVPFPLGATKTWIVQHLLVTILVGVLLLAVMTWGYSRRIHRRMPSLPTVARYLTVTGALLVAGTLVQLTLATVATVRATRHGALAAALAKPVRIRTPSPTDPATASSGTRHDIYIVILDEYASSAVYRERYAFDNTPFEDSLKALGFRIPASVRSNYANTLMSVSSFLNFTQMQPLADAVNPRSRDFSPAAYFIQHNRTARFLKHQGYRFVFFPSGWYPPTLQDDDADEQYSPYNGFDLRRAMARSPAAGYVGSATPFSKLVPYLPSTNAVIPNHVELTFRGLATLRRGARPTFALAHVLMPHTPFRVDSTCRPIPNPDVDGRLPGELQCLNRHVLETVHALLAQSRPKPIIILQGDHGSQSLKPFARLGVLPNTAQARERFRPFGAYYLPDGGDAAMPDSISLVNVLRYVFGYYFNADLPPLPNTMYFSDWRSPYRLTMVDGDFHVVLHSRESRRLSGAM